MSLRSRVFPLGCLLAVFPSGILAAQETPELVSRSEQEEALVLPTGTQIPLVLQNTLNTRNTREGDRAYFETIYPIIEESRIVIPVGSYIRGTVTLVKRPGRVKGRAEIHVRFDELTLPNGYTVKLSATLANAGSTGNEEVDRAEGGVKGETNKGEDASTVIFTTASGAAIGAATTGRGSGAGTGAAIGAGVGLATVLLTRGKELVLERGTTVDITLDRPLPLDRQLVQFDWPTDSDKR